MSQNICVDISVATIPHEKEGDRVAAAACIFDLGDDGLRFSRTAAVMYQDLSAGDGERECTSAADCRAMHP